MGISIAKKAVDVDSLKVTIVFSDGRKVEVEAGKLAQSIKTALMLHGLSQKLGDAYSGAKGDITAAYAECSSVADSLKAGDWKRRGEGSGGDLAIAIANLTERDLAEVIAMLASKDKEAKAAMRKRADIKAEMAKIAADRAEAALKGAEEPEADLGDLFAE